MEINEKKLEGETLLLSLNGRLDPTTVAHVEERLDQVIEGGVKKIIINLANLEYISSAGLRVLLVGAKRLQTIEGKLVLCSPRRYVKEVLDIAGFSSIMTVYDSEQEAVSKLR